MALLCAILACIALLQFVVFRSRTGQDASYSAPVIHDKRQLFSSVTTYSAETDTFFGTTMTFSDPASTATYPGTTETEPPQTKTKYYVATSVSGLATTIEVELTTSNGVATYFEITEASAITSIAYLDTATPTSDVVFASTAAPQSYLDTSTPSSEPFTASATPTTAYLATSTPSTQTTVTSPSVFQSTSLAGSFDSTKISIAIPPSLSTPSTAYLGTSAPSVSGPTTSNVLDIASLPQTDRIVNGGFTMPKYYIATYLCTLVVVLLKCAWSVIFASTKVMEPFYQLTRPGGADLNVSLLADYLSSGFSMTTLSGLFTQRPLMLLAIVVSAIAMVMAPLASEAMSIKSSALCPQSDGTVRHCAPVWLLNIPCVRSLQALFSLMFCLIMTYIVLSSRRHSGIFSDPTSISSVASMLGDPDFVYELRHIPADASTKDIKKWLKGNKYALAAISARDGTTAFGIVKTNNLARTSTYSRDGGHPADMMSKKATWKYKYLQDFLRLFLTLGVLGLVLAYYLDSRPDSFNNFFNSNTFGPRFILSTAAVILENRWKSLEREVRIMQPYRNLHKKAGNTEGKAGVDALLANMASSTYSSLPIALWRGDLFLALVSCVAVLGDVLIIAVTGVPFSDAQVYTTFQVSTWLSVGILSLMALTSLAVVGWRRGNPRGMPREPNTLINVALYLCSSQVTEQLVPLSMLPQRERDRVIRNWGGQYWFGRGLGVDEKARWLVDRDDGNH